MSNLFKLLKSAQSQGAKFHEAVRTAYGAGDKAAIIGCAEAIEAAYPVSKEDGKGPDANRDARNGFLSALRVTLGRIGKDQETPRKVTVKKVEGVWTLVDEAIAAPTPEDEPATPEAGEPDGVGLEDEAAQEALWEAVKLVTANLGNKAVRIAIADALKAELAKAAKV